MDIAPASTPDLDGTTSVVRRADRCQPGPDGPLRLQHGEAEIVMLSDGFFPLPSGIVAPAALAAEWTDIETRLSGRGGEIHACVNVPVLRIGRELIVVDLGGGGTFAPTEGSFFARFLAEGLDPRAVTRVLLTHAHPDHLGGLLDGEGRLRFPNGVYYLSGVEWAFWSDTAGTMPTPLVPFALAARRNFAAMRDRVVHLTDGVELPGGLRALATPGHTPGHLSFIVPGAKPLILAGDALTNEVVSVEHPAWHFGYDTNPNLAAATRAWLLDRLASDGGPACAVHFAYPGLGRVERRGEGFRFIPFR
ncbi:MBL fold metallo-hydrolase (plasmid) [Roseomonas sp. CCTCC AB2023176]|uniref:MBL fold metallo-hydrolase n=1 Tax=Roseomonas sp. CCTCC AB2023176 TaxID=3342640 RepID=UPI0035D81462